MQTVNHQRCHRGNTNLRNARGVRSSGKKICRTRRTWGLGGRYQRPRPHHIDPREKLILNNSIFLLTFIFLKKAGGAFRGSVAFWNNAWQILHIVVLYPLSKQGDSCGRVEIGMRSLTLKPDTVNTGVGSFCFICWLCPQEWHTLFRGFFICPT